MLLLVNYFVVDYSGRSYSNQFRRYIYPDFSIIDSKQLEYMLIAHPFRLPLILKIPKTLVKSPKW